MDLTVHYIHLLASFQYLAVLDWQAHMYVFFPGQKIINWHENMAFWENAKVIQVHLYLDYLHFLQYRNVKTFPLNLINIWMFIQVVYRLVHT